MKKWVLPRHAVVFAVLRFILSPFMMLIFGFRYRKCRMQKVPPLFVPPPAPAFPHAGLSVPPDPPAADTVVLPKTTAEEPPPPPEYADAPPLALPQPPDPVPPDLVTFHPVTEI